MFSVDVRQVILVVSAGLGASCAEEPGAPDLVLSVDQRDCRPGDACSYEFDDLYVGEELAHAFVLENRGDLPVSVEGVEFTSTASYELTQSFSGVMAGQESAPIVVTFAPNGYAEQDSQLVITAGDPPANLRLDLLSAALFPQGDIGTDGCNFASVPVGTTATGCTVYISNSTPVELELTGVGLDPPFAVAQAMVIPAFVPPGSMITIALSVTPTVLGMATASLTLRFGTAIVVTGLSVNGT